MLALRMDPTRAAPDPCGVGAGRLSGAATRRPPARRRDGGGKGIRHVAHRRRHSDPARSGLAGGARVEELPIEEMWVGHRPGSRDDAPILGTGPIDGLIYATGHHRNGILLAPITADAIAGLVLEAPPTRRSGRSASNDLGRASGCGMKEIAMTIRRRSDYPGERRRTSRSSQGRSPRLLEEKAVDTGQRGIAVAVNGAVVPRAAWAADAASAWRQRRDRARPAGRLRRYRNVRSPDHCRPRIRSRLFLGPPAIQTGSSCSTPSPRAAPRS